MAEYIDETLLASLIKEYGGSLRAVSGVLDVPHPVLRSVVRKLYPMVNTESQRLMQTTHKRTVSQMRSRRLLRKDLCSYCGIHPSDTEDGMITIDHVVPKSAGGENNLTNMTGACYDCNQAKASKSLLFFMLERREEVACMT